MSYDYKIFRTNGRAVASLEELMETPRPFESYESVKAMLSGLVKTPRSRSSALLLRMTRPDQRLARFAMPRFSKRRAARVPAHSDAGRALASIHGGWIRTELPWRAPPNWPEACRH